MMKKTFKICCGFFTLAALLAVGFRLYPIFADDDDLIFTPVTKEEPQVNHELLETIRNKNQDLKLTSKLEKKIQDALEAPYYVDVVVAFSLLRRLKENGESIPEIYVNEEFLTSRLVLSLKNEVLYLYQMSVAHPNITEQIRLSSLGTSPMRDKIDYIQFRALEIFTFQRNKTFNTLWTQVEEFENSPTQDLKVDVDFRDFGFDNFFGKVYLACVTPTVRKQIENIQIITSNMSGGANSD